MLKRKHPNHRIGRASKSNLHAFDEFKQQIVTKINMVMPKNLDARVLHILHVAVTYLFKYKSRLSALALRKRQVKGIRKENFSSMKKSDRKIYR